MKSIAPMKRIMSIVLLLCATAPAALAQEAASSQPPEKQDISAPAAVPEKNIQTESASLVQQIAESEEKVRGLENRLRELESAGISEARTEHPLAARFKEKFIDLLDSEDPAVRASAVECLAALRIPFAEIKKRIIKVLADETPEVRSSGVEAIRALNVPLSEVKASLLAMLKDEDDDVRVKALRLLIDLKVPAEDVKATLLRDYERKEGQPPLDVIRGMVELGIPTERVKSDLLRDLDHRDWFIQRYAMRGLIILRVPYPEIKGRLLKKLQGRELQIRLGAVRWLIASAPPAEMKDELFAKLNDYYGEVRNEAVEGLPKSGLDPEEIKKKLIEKIGDESELVQRTVFGMLGDLPVSLDDSKEVLLEKLDSKSSLVRLDVIRCLLLHRIKDERITAALMQLLDEGVEESIPLLLQSDVSAGQVKDRFLDKLNSGDKFMQLEAIGALKAFNVPADRMDEKLTSYVRDANPVIRQMTMEIMIRSGMTVEDIVKTIRDEKDICHILEAWDKVRAQNAEFQMRAVTGELAQAREALAALRAEEKKAREEENLRAEDASAPAAAIPPPEQPPQPEAPPAAGVPDAGAAGEGEHE